MGALTKRSRNGVGNSAVAQAEIGEFGEQIGFQQGLQAVNAAAPAIVLLAKPDFQMLQIGQLRVQNVLQGFHRQAAGFHNQRFQMRVVQAAEAQARPATYPKCSRRGYALNSGDTSV